MQIAEYSTLLLMYVTAVCLHASTKTWVGVKCGTWNEMEWRNEIWNGTPNGKKPEGHLI